MTPTEFRAWRKRLGLSRAAAASALGLSSSRLADYESGIKRGSYQPAVVPKYVAFACAAIELALELGVKAEYEALLAVPRRYLVRDAGSAGGRRSDKA